MNCPCGGVATDTTYYPVGQDVRQVTYKCQACDRRMVLIYDADTGKLIERRG